MFQQLVNEQVGKVLKKFVVLQDDSLSLNPFTTSPTKLQLRLTDLQIKKDALEGLSSTFHMHSGSVGAITISIPYTHLFSSAVKVEIRDVFLVLRTSDTFDRDAHIRGVRKKVSTAIMNANTSEKIRAHAKGAKLDQILSFQVDHIQVRCTSRK